LTSFGLNIFERDILDEWCAEIEGVDIYLNKDLIWRKFRDDGRVFHSYLADSPKKSKVKPEKHQQLPRFGGFFP